MLCLATMGMLQACGGSTDANGTPAQGAASMGTLASQGDDCAQLSIGRWSANGAAFGMQMDVDLAFNATACSFALSNWSMQHGSLPTGGQVVGSTVSLAGAKALWQTCAGVVTAGVISGKCSANNAAFELAPKGG